MALYPMRYIARVVLEARTPLFVGSGSGSLVKDAVVATDAYGFPYIPGTSLCGVIRHALEDTAEDASVWKEIFGYADKKSGKGAKLRVSSAYLVLENEVPALDNVEKYEGLAAKHFRYLPTRNHVRINHRGVAMDKGLFDNEVVYKGCRFVAELEMRGDKADQPNWEKVLDVLRASTFRVGHGTRRGYGRLAAIYLEDHRFDLRVDADFDAYLNYNPSFCPVVAPERLPQLKQQSCPPSEGEAMHYQLVLKPESFFFFGSGQADEEVDDVPVAEHTVYYDDHNCIHFSEKPQYLIPGSSIKGALRHRTCYHFNLLKERYAEVFANSPLEKIVVEGMNSAVYALFGLEGGTKLEHIDHDGFLEADDNAARTGRRGVVLVDDLFIYMALDTHIFNHVAIDRFTGGPIDGALYAEKATYLTDELGEVHIDIHVVPFEAREKELIEQAFEMALMDVCRGLLPLGGLTTKGHGVFVGQLWKNGQKIFDYEQAIASAK